MDSNTPPAPASNYPFLLRQLHPWIIHFTIVFMLSIFFFTILYYLTGWRAFETTAFHFLGAGLASIPLSIFTGLLSQRRLYPAQLRELFRVEIIFSWFMLAVNLIAFLWRLYEPQILITWSRSSWIYLLLIFSLTPMVTITSFFGGLLVFPLEKNS